MFKPVSPDDSKAPLAAKAASASDDKSTDPGAAALGSWRPPGWLGSSLREIQREHAQQARSLANDTPGLPSSPSANRLALGGYQELDEGWILISKDPRLRARVDREAGVVEIRGNAEERFDIRFSTTQGDQEHVALQGVNGTFRMNNIGSVRITTVPIVEQREAAAPSPGKGGNPKGPVSKETEGHSEGDSVNLETTDPTSAKKTKTPNSPTKPNSSDPNQEALPRITTHTLKFEILDGPLQGTELTFNPRTMQLESEKIQTSFGEAILQLTATSQGNQEIVMKVSDGPFAATQLRYDLESGGTAGSFRATLDNGFSLVVEDVGVLTRDPQGWKYAVDFTDGDGTKYRLSGCNIIPPSRPTDLPPGLTLSTSLGGESRETAFSFSITRQDGAKLGEVVVENGHIREFTGTVAHLDGTITYGVTDSPSADRITAQVERPRFNTTNLRALMNGEDPHTATKGMSENSVMLPSSGGLFAQQHEEQYRLLLDYVAANDGELRALSVNVTGDGRIDRAHSKVLIGGQEINLEYVRGAWTVAGSIDIDNAQKPVSFRLSRDDAGGLAFHAATTLRGGEIQVALGVNGTWATINGQQAGLSLGVDRDGRFGLSAHYRGGNLVIALNLSHRQSEGGVYYSIPVRS